MKQLQIMVKASDGGVPIHDPGQVKAVVEFLKSLAGQRVEITYRHVRDVRSLAQNRRYWSMIVPCVAEVLSAGREIPLSRDQAHEVLKYAFIGHEDTPLGPLAKSSKELTVPEFIEYCDRIEGWLATDWKVVIPERGEEL